MQGSGNQSASVFLGLLLATIGLLLGAILLMGITDSLILVLLPVAVFSAPVAVYLGASGLNGGRAGLAVLIIVSVVIMASSIKKGAVTELDFQSFVKLGVYCMAFLFGALSLRYTHQILTTPLGMLLTAYWFVTALTALVSPAPIYTLGSSFGLIAWILLAAALGCHLSSRELHLFLATGTSLFVFISWFLYLFVPSMGTLMFTTGDVQIPRFTGLAGTPNGAGQVLVLHLVVVLSLLLSRRDFERRSAFFAGIMFLIAAGLALVGIVLTQSRGSMLALMAVVFGYACQRTESVPLAVIGALSGLLLLLALPNPFSVIEDLFVAASRGGSVDEILTMTGRTAIWSFVLDEFMASPFLGYGYGGGRYMISAGYTNAWGGGVGGSAHNAFLHSLLEVGVIGTIFFVGIFVYAAIQFFKRPSFLRDGVFLLVLVTGLLESGVSSSANVLTFVWLLTLLHGEFAKATADVAASLGAGDQGHRRPPVEDPRNVRTGTVRRTAS